MVLRAAGAAVMAALLPATVALSPSAEVTVGAVRVQALSDTLLRIEPRGPRGFEDNTTFMVVSRDWAGVPLTKVKSAGDTTTLATAQVIVTVEQPSTPPAPPPSPPGPAPMCTAHVGYDLRGTGRIPSCPESAASCLPGKATQAQCCGACTSHAACKSWIYDPKAGACWLMGGAASLVPAHDRVSGGDITGHAGPNPTHVKVTVADKATGVILWSVDDLDSVSQNLNWPSPGYNQTIYAIKDYPRFYVPPWGPTPIPAGVSVEPALAETNGYDFRNDQTGDTYLFLLAGGLDAWQHSRREFVQLAGPTPALPDFAFGTWFTFWHTYTEATAKAEVMRWKTDSLPIDVWALDMNWRNSKTAHGKNFIPCHNTGLPGPDENCTSQDHYYNYPDCDAFPDFCGGASGTDGTGWFDWLRAQKL
jgi:hypothetical protein